MAMPVVDAEYRKEIDKARRDLRALISFHNCAPIMLRLAWHDAFSYDVNTKTGGPDASVRNQKDYFGLGVAIDLCEEIKCKHPSLTYADLYQLAGVVAVEVSGGPTVDFVPGRKDSEISLEKVQLPDVSEDYMGGVPQLRDIFYRMGLLDRDIVALTGGRETMAAVQANGSSCDGLWTNERVKFDNSYFVELLRRGSEGLNLLSDEKTLLDDPGFRYYVELYAMDADSFFRDYSLSHRRLSELGFTPSSIGGGGRGVNFLGFVVAAAVVLFSYLYIPKRRM